MNKLFYLLIGAAVLSGCSKSNETCGTYNGTLPAADGPGIEMTVRLGPDNKFENKLVYIDAEDGTFYEQGTYSQNGDLIELKSGDEISYYKAEPGQLRRLDHPAPAKAAGHSGQKAAALPRAHLAGEVRLRDRAGRRPAAGRGPGAVRPHPPGVLRPGAGRAVGAESGRRP